MSCVDGFVLPVPRKPGGVSPHGAHRSQGLARTRRARSPEWTDDEVKPEKLTSFPQSVMLKPGQAVLFSWIVFKSRASRSGQRQGHEGPASGRQDGSQVAAFRRQADDLWRI